LIIYNSQKLEDLYSCLEKKSMTDLMNSWGYTSVNDWYNCLKNDDKTPSMHVEEEKGVWFCFSCSTGGKIGKLIQHYYLSNFGIKYPLEAMERFLKDNPEIATEVGFTTLRTASYNSVSEKSYKNILDFCDRRLKRSPEEVEMKFKKYPVAGCSASRELIEHLSKVQNGYINIEENRRRR